MNNTIQSIDRAFEILETLARESRGLGIKEISERVSLNKSTVHRILSTLMAWGYVEKKNKEKLYRIGMKIVDLGSIYLNNIELKTEALPYLHELKDKFNQVVHLGILEDGDVVYIEKINVFNNIRMYSKIGKRITAHNTGLGKVMLAYMKKDEVERIIDIKGMPKVTGNTITDKKEFSQELEKIKVQGYAIDDEENEEGLRCAASPIFDYTGNVISAVSITAPKNVFTYEKLEQEVSHSVKNIAAKISARMGYKG